ncbi:MAG TPA: radical SAM protein [Anaerolineae bacterium]|nr:radical SAM protein [Anaerolineae bacterium]HQH38463.1 radical SAM protein [Anaerolineae bacterium]
MITITPIQEKAINIAADVLVSHGPKLAQNETLRRHIVNRIEKHMLTNLEHTRSDPNYLPGIADDRTAMSLAIVGTIERALVENHLSEAALRAAIQILVKTLFLRQGNREQMIHLFKEQYGIGAPSFLVISPGKACNLHCTGCYADSDDKARNLAWSTVDRIITEAKTLWGARFFVISGGEPFAYRSEGKSIVDIIERHADCMFLMYTNGTLITPEISQRLARTGNLLPAISVEGWKERTDARRGEGIFDQVVNTMHLLRHDGIPFGISLTGTRYNAEEILSDEFIDFFQQQGALFAWLFQYMPIGRSFTLDLMPTPQQRLWMWRRSWEIIRTRRMFIADFWNHGTACDGCLSAGGHGNGGYFYIDWNGAISPCVFLPYSPLNINTAYAQGKTLNDVWADPFFHSLRQWQFNYKNKNGNGLMPCPNRDHHADLQRLIMEHEPDPIDVNAAAALADPEYAQGLAQYDAEYEALTHNIWETHYVHRAPAAKDGGIAPLPSLLDLQIAAPASSTAR